MFSNFKKVRQFLAISPYKTLAEKVLAASEMLDHLEDAQVKVEFDSLTKQISNEGESKALKIKAFALIYQAVHRSLGIKPYGVQVQGAIALAENVIIEMATGEGKTIVAAMAACYKTIAHRNVHVATANEYLANRDCMQMFPVFKMLGVSCSVRLSHQGIALAQQVYAHQVTYGTATRFAQDYLSDNLAQLLQNQVLNGLNALVLDEADTTLIDTARVPISSTTARPLDTELFEKLKVIAEQLKRGEVDSQEGADFYLDHKNRNALFTDDGYVRVEALLRQDGLLVGDSYSGDHQHLLRTLQATLGAMYLLQSGYDYVVQNGAIVLVDPQTGRLAPDRRWDAGLQQALEAKEGLELTPEPLVLARITLQNFIKLYSAVCGMSGTAETEAEEFQRVYGLAVVVIPQNTPSIRIDHPDEYLVTQTAKLDAVFSDIAARHAKGQPVLVGTASVEQSEELGQRLADAGISHEILNARQHEREAFIISQAGRLGAVTISTNMAGRGVDIILGGSIQMHEAVAMAAKGAAVHQERLTTLVSDLKDCFGVPEPARFVDNILKEGRILIVLPEDFPVETLADRFSSLGFEARIDGRDLTVSGSQASVQRAVALFGKEVGLTAEEEAAVMEQRAQERDAVFKAGGLHVIGMERYESRRQDTQLRGRAGRQGDPGSSCFYISLEDPLVANFAGESIRRIFKTLEISEDDDFRGQYVAKAILHAQREVEGRNADGRAQIMQFDNVLHEQRQAYYSNRQQVLAGNDNLSWILEHIGAYAEALVGGDVFDAEALEERWVRMKEAAACFGIGDSDLASMKDLGDDELISKLTESLIARLDAITEVLSAAGKENFVRYLMLRSMDRAWINHLEELEHLRRGIHLRGHAKEDPQRAYKREAFHMFSVMLESIPEDAVTSILTSKVLPSEEAEVTDSSE